MYRVPRHLPWGVAVAEVDPANGELVDGESCLREQEINAFLVETALQNINEMGLPKKEVYPNIAILMVKEIFDIIGVDRSPILVHKSS